MSKGSKARRKSVRNNENGYYLALKNSRRCNTLNEKTKGYCVLHGKYVAESSMRRKHCIGCNSFIEIRKRGEEQ